MASKHKTPGLRPILGCLIIVMATATCSFLFLKNSDHASAYPAACVSQACREAFDRANSSSAAAQQAAENAQTLEGEITKLNSEISALEDQIAMNQAIAADLAEQIADNEAKLTLQRTALAKLLVDMYDTEDPDAITLLASSSSLGDLAEKQTREESVRSQVTSTTQSVKALKDQLEAQKTSVDALIASAELSRNEIAVKRNRQEALRAKYANDSAAYERDAAAARETMQREIAAEIARNNASGVVGEGYNSYPWADRCPQDNVAYLVVGGYVCQCTSYAGWKAQEYYGIYISGWGNAKDWGNTASRLGYVVNNTPSPHSIAYSTAGIYGHVMWVESVNGNDTINLTEYNNSGSSKSGLPGDFGARYNVNPHEYRYIHLDQRLW